MCWLISMTGHKHSLQHLWMVHKHDVMQISILILNWKVRVFFNYNWVCVDCYHTTHPFFNNMHLLFWNLFIQNSPHYDKCFSQNYVSLGICFGPYSICHGCMEDNIKGFGWKCTRCIHYTLCSSCYFSGKHLLDHQFARFDTVNSRSVIVALLAHYCIPSIPSVIPKLARNYLQGTYDQSHIL